MGILVVDLAIHNPLHLCARVWPPEMIFWNIIGEITGCFEEIQGV